MTSAALTPGYAGHPDADLLAQLATELAPMNMGTIVAFGTQADAENATGARVFFIEKKWRTADRKLQPADGNASFEGQRRYDVAIYAPDMGMLWRLFTAVQDKLDYLLSWTAIELGDATDPGPRGTGAGSAGFGTTFPAIVKGPVYREAYGVAPAETVTIRATIAEPASDETEAIPPDPIAVGVE